MNVFLLKDKVYTEYKEKVMRYMLKKVQNPHDAEDLTSEVFLKVFKSIESFNENKASISTWIYTVARNTVIDYYRTRKDTAELDENLTAENADTSLFKNEMLEALAAALESIDERSRNIVILHYYNGLPLKSIAEAMGISYSHTKLLHNKALTELKKYF